MQLRRMLLTLFLAGLCCVSLAACTPENTPSEPESSSSGDTLTTTLLPGGWDAADFTVLLLDKYGPMDGASPVTLTDEEQKELLSLLSGSDWEVIDPDTLPPHDPSFFVTLQAPDGRTLGVGSLINSDQSMLALEDEETYLLYAGSPEAVEQAQALRETVTARRDSLLPSGEAEILYPDLLPEALTSTGAYRTAAADPTAVINYAGRIATGRTAVDTFCKALENGGTGELTLMLTQAGYDMIGIDQSEEMLCVVRDKAEQLGLSSGLLLLRQDLLKLDLYGTIRGAVSTFDTFNHIPDLDKAIANAGFFMEKGGVLLFDMNTPYKHQNVLGENVFTFEEEDASCVWRNHYSAADRRVEISVDIDYRETGEHFHEQFYEYTYDLDTIRTALEKHGFALESVCDGETFGPLTGDSQRYFFCAVKQYTQLEG